MNRFRFEAFLKEFPFLEVILREKERFDPGKVDSIRVQRVDENFLRRVLHNSFHDGSAGVSRHREELWAVFPDGSVQPVPTQNEYSWSSNYAHSQSEHGDGEPILEALVGFEEARFLVLLERHLDDWPGGDYIDYFNILVYKPSRQTSISLEIEKARKQALAQVRAEADL